MRGRRASAETEALLALSKIADQINFSNRLVAYDPHCAKASLNQNRAQSFVGDARAGAGRRRRVGPAVRSAHRGVQRRGDGASSRAWGRATGDPSLKAKASENVADPRSATLGGADTRANSVDGRGTAARTRRHACIFLVCSRMARPKRFELLTPRFVVWCSIQLSYGRAGRRGGPADARQRRSSKRFWLGSQEAPCISAGRSPCPRRAPPLIQAPCPIPVR